MGLRQRSQECAHADLACCPGTRSGRSVGRLDVPAAPPRRERTWWPHYRSQLLRCNRRDRAREYKRAAHRGAGVSQVRAEPMRIALALSFVVSIPAALVAHGDEMHSLNTPRAFSPWDLGVLGVLLIVGALYAQGVLTLSRRGGGGRRFEPIGFAIGWG